MGLIVAAIRARPQLPRSAEPLRRRLNYRFKPTLFHEPLNARPGGESFAERWHSEAEADHALFSHSLPLNVANASATSSVSVVRPPRYRYSPACFANASAFLAEISDDWETERAYLNMEAR